MLSTVWEALELEKPLIVPYTRTLSRMLSDYVVYYCVDEASSLSRVLKNVLSNEAFLNEMRKNVRELRRVLDARRRVQMQSFKHWIESINSGTPETSLW